jgi:hypothetical protein
VELQTLRITPLMVQPTYRLYMKCSVWDFFTKGWSSKSSWLRFFLAPHVCWTSECEYSGVSERNNFSSSSGIYNPFLYVRLNCNFIRFIFRKVVAERLSMILCADLIQPWNFFWECFYIQNPCKEAQGHTSRCFCGVWCLYCLLALTVIECMWLHLQ